MTRPRIGYAGMTHLGLNYAAAAADRGFDTICFDSDAATIKSLAAGKLPVAEPDLDVMVARNAGRLKFTSSGADLAACDVVYVAPDVPTDDKGASDLAPIRSLIDRVGSALQRDALLVVLSQVPPGFCRVLGRDPAATFYQVETLIFGRAVERATRPERFIVGCAEPARALPDAYRAFLESFGCPILPMRYESAELAKIAINMFLVSSVSTANTLAGICEKIGAAWPEILPALRLDRRIGEHAYLNPGLGIAGGNLERDLATVVALGDAHGTDVGVVRAWQANSRYRRDWALRMLNERVLGTGGAASLAILGLAYKENTHSTKNSPALALLAALGPYAVRVFDPIVQPRAEWHPRLVRADTALDACNAADALAIMTPWPQFRALKPAEVAARLRGKIVVDPFACLDRAACRTAGLTHFTLGAAP
ncbi:MAG: nucleotide sugar dehydrogenase [Rhodospirillales bacterium]